MGTSFASVGELATLTEEIPEIQEIIEDTNIKSKKQITEIRKKVGEVTLERAMKIPSLRDLITGTERVTQKVLQEVTIGKINVKDGKVVSYDYDCLLKGNSERAYMHHVVKNRAISQIKTDLTPKAGYLTRQLADLSMDVIYDPDYVNGEQAGALIPAKYAYGRKTPLGEVIGRNVPEDKLVRVESVIYSKELKANANMIRTDIFVYQKNANIGIGLLTDVSEGITQGSLELKHTGELIVYTDNKFIFNYESGVILNIDNRFITIQVGSQELKFLLPSEYDRTNKMTVGYNLSKYDILYHVSKPLKPDYKYINFGSIVGAHMPSVSTTRATMAYALRSGEVHYFPKGKNMMIEIGGVVSKVDDSSIYYFPEGTKVDVLKRICSGFQDMSQLANMDDLGKQFFIFQDQLRKDWKNLNSELLEMLFFCLRNGGTIQKAKKILEKEKSLISGLNYGYTAGYVKKFINKPIGQDFLTNFILRTPKGGN